VAVCPACGFENPAGLSECQRCRLATHLFDPVREAAGTEGDPRYLAAISDILGAVDAGPETESDAPELSSPTVAKPAWFPGLPSSGIAPPPSHPHHPAGLPALPPAGDVPALLHQVNEYLQLARRQGLDLQEFGQRAREGVLTQDRESLETLSRELFVNLASSITTEYEDVLARRDELAGLVPTDALDLEVEGSRAALALGDLAGAQRRLRHLDSELSDLEDQWATVQILVAEGELIATTVRELGGDPAPGLGPLGEGRRLAQEGNRDAAEPVLARGTLALWTVLDPLLLTELARLKAGMVAMRGRGVDMAPAVTTLRQLAADLRHRNFAAAIAAYRHLQAMVGSPATTTGLRA
jgi:hypothetical protein